MGKFEKTGLVGLLCVTALAWAAMAIPGLVVIGFVMLIVPGLILALSPAVALYGWLFAAPYAALRSVGLAWWRAALVAALVPLAFGWGRPSQSNAETRANLLAAVATDVRPAQPLPIGGTVALVRGGDTGGWREKDNGCDDLCLRLLYNGDARTVYIGQRGRPGLAFTLERRAACPRFAYAVDAEKWRGWPSAATSHAGTGFAPKLGLKEVVEARVAGGDCLVSVSGRIRPDWTIERIALPRDDLRDDWSTAAGTVQGERITVYRREGSEMRPAGRFTNAHASTLSVPLMPGMVGGIESSRWTWSRTTAGGDRRDRDSVTALRSLVAFNADIPKGAPPARMRELLAQALADPRRVRDDAGLLLANSVAVDIVRNGARPGDGALVAKALADPRFTRIDFPWGLAAKLGIAFEPVGEAALDRLVERSNTDDRDSVGALGGLVASLPDRSFAPPPARVLDALRDAGRADRLRSVVVKVGSMGDAAVPILAEIVRGGAERASTIEDGGYDRQFSLQTADLAARELCKLGSRARRALPVIQAAWARLDATSRDRGSADRNPGRYGARHGGKKIGERRIITLMALGDVPIGAFTPPREPSITTNGSWQRYIAGQVENSDCSISGAAAGR